MAVLKLTLSQAPLLSLGFVLLRCAIPHPPLTRCHPRIHDSRGCGVRSYDGAGRLERCELWGNATGGVLVRYEGAGPTLAACTIRDHAVDRAAGVHVEAGCHATVGADCVFARNAGGDVVRD